MKDKKEIKVNESKPVRDYQYESTRVFNRNLASPGFIYLIIRYKNRKMMQKYQNVKILPFFGLTEEMKVVHYDAMWDELKEKYPMMIW